MTRIRKVLAAFGIAAAVTAGAAACNPLDYGCIRQGSHGAVVCHNTNHNPSATAGLTRPDGSAVLARGSSWN